MDTETAYNLALDYLYSFVDYSLKHASELAKAEFNLERMFALLERLSNPHLAYPVIHVAGTKGKGSVSALCAGALQAAGYKTGLYTSPHLQDYAERIQINGESIPHGKLADLVDEIKPAVASAPFLTTFEITTALAFLYFARERVTAAVIEVGLGGRLDATNVVSPLVSVITSLSYDHTAVLGDTLTLIAGEKAGIIKPGRPVVSSPQKDEARIVVERVAAERGCELTLVGRDVQYALLDHSIDGQTFNLSAFNGQPVDFSIPLLGAYQVENAATAYAALLAARANGLDIPDEAIRRGFAGTKWRARFEIVRREPPLIFDSAHNPDSFSRMSQALEDYFPGHPVYLIFGASEDKKLDEMFASVKSKVRRLIVTRADHPRALEPGKISLIAEQAGVPCETVEPVEAALARALELSAKDGSIVLSAGSMFVTAEAMTAWDKLNSKVTGIHE